MSVTTWPLFGPHHTARSPAVSPRAARPAATRSISAPSSAWVVGRTVVFGPEPGAPAVRSADVARLDPPAVALPHGPPERRGHGFRRGPRRPRRVRLHAGDPEGHHRRRHPRAPPAPRPVARS